MCLTRVDMVYDDKKERFITGYKVIEIDMHGRLRPMYKREYKNHRPLVFKTNQWMKNKLEYAIVADDGQRYQSGFHLFETVADAMKYKRLSGNYDCVVFKVEARRVTARGKQIVFNGSIKDGVISEYLTTYVVQEIKLAEREE